MLTTDRPEAYLRALQDSVVGNIDLVLCVLSNGRKDRYDLLKKYLCLDNPVPSQVGLVLTFALTLSFLSLSDGSSEDHNTPKSIDVCCNENRYPNQCKIGWRTMEHTDSNQDSDGYRH